MQALEQWKNDASNWFVALQSQIINALEEIEIENNSQALFQKKTWKREDPAQMDAGGGVMAILRGKIFEKAGVNVSTVYGQFDERFAKTIPGAEENPNFWASGISIVIHPKNPYVPIVHMNTRMISTQATWFGGGMDLTPVIPFDEDTKDFHQALEDTCNKYNNSYYKEFKKWCDEYFFLKHRNEARGIGGIFYDYQYVKTSNDFDNLFAFTKDVGLKFKQIYIDIVKRHIYKTFGENELKHQSHKRSRYVEFNLIYDRGTKFGLETGGNTEAILMSMPPSATWV